jgi:hypothetical protein
MTSRTRTRRPSQRPATPPAEAGHEELRNDSDQIPPEEPKAPSTELVLYGEPIEVEDDTKPGKTKRAWVNTPYQAAKVLNAMVAEAGIEKVVPPQMVYTYAKNGKFTTFIAADGTGRKVVDTDTFNTWAAGYIVGLKAKIAKAEAKVAEDLAA